MRIGGIRDVTYRAAELAAALAWWRDELGLVVVEGSPAEGRIVLEAPDERQVVLTATAAEPVAVSWWSPELDAGTNTTVTDPAGHAIAVWGPPLGETAEDIEGRLTEFITAAEPLEGPPVDELADRVAAIVAAAAAEIGTAVEGVAHNKVLATQLLLSQRSRHVETGSASQWHLSAASTLLAERIIPRSEG